MKRRTALSSTIPRRRLFRTAAGGVLCATAAGATRYALPGLVPSVSAQTSQPSPRIALTRAVLRAFEEEVQTAMSTFDMVGAAVAIIQENRIVYSRGFGIRELDSAAPVTERTRFRIASNTKSMTSLLVATFVDEGVLSWDDRVIDIWPDFRTPQPELTQEMRVRDLMGHATGLGEQSEFYLSAGLLSGRDVLRSIADLPVVHPPFTAYHYNNTLVAAAGYLGALRRRIAPEALDQAYVDQMRQRVFAPIGMVDAAVASDPRRFGPDYAVGYTVSLLGGFAPVPFVSIHGEAPAGAVVASVTDMARYLITQLNGGVTPAGRRVVSAANLAETHRPGIDVPPDGLNALPAALLRDTVAMRYCLGWFDQTFRGGRRLLWHAGGIDGFGSLMGLFPDEEIGFVFLTNMEPRFSGLFNFSVQSSLLSRLFGLNETIPALLASAVPVIRRQLAGLATQTVPVDPEAVTPYLGYYTTGFQVDFVSPDWLFVRHDIRTMRLLAHQDGGYVFADGPLLASRVRFALNAAGVPTMTIDGLPTVTWLTGG